jgi:hypothetical protein
MSDSNEGQIPTEGTVEPMPSSEQPTESGQEPTLPDGASERTQAEFEKLKAHNQTLARELEALKAAKPSVSSVLDELRPNAGAAPQVAAPAAPSQSLIDQEGYVDANLLNSAVNSSQKAAEEARRIAIQTQEQIQRFQESQVVQAVHKDFPEMDPNSDQFDPTFYDFVKNDLIGQMMQGKEDLRAAADKARKTLAKQAAAPRKDTTPERGQASAPTSTSHSTPAPIDHDDLVRRTYKGDNDAIFKRLQASGN